MTLFYAYLKDTVHDVYYRYMLTFESREAADEWWRLVSTAPSPYAGNIKRIAPQYFVQNTAKLNIVTFFSNAALKDANKWLDKMFFTLLNDRDARVLSIAPPIGVTDHISGNWYFIRSQDDLNRHWYFCGGGECLVCGRPDCSLVHVSTKYRSRFHIQVRSSSDGGYQAPKDLVIIGSDQVTITAPNDYILRVTDGELRGTKWTQVPTSNTLFLFSDIRDRFETRAVKVGGGLVYEYVKVVERGWGELWGVSN